MSRTFVTGGRSRTAAASSARRRAPGTSTATSPSTTPPYSSATTASGALATFEASRFATGHKNGMRLELNGSAGSIVVDLERMNELGVYDARQDNPGFRTILVTEPTHPYVAAWWPPGHTLGYEHAFTHQVRDFVEAIIGRPGRAPDLRRRPECPAGARRRGAERGRERPVGRSRDRDHARRNRRRARMSRRPITLFTGQWADLPFTEVCQLASQWGYDGLEIACWGDHLRRGPRRIRRCLPGRAQARSWPTTASRCTRSRTTSSARPSAITRSTSGTRASCRPGSGAMASPRASGSGPPRR